MIIIPDDNILSVPMKSGQVIAQPASTVDSGVEIESNRSSSLQVRK